MTTFDLKEIVSDSVLQDLPDSFYQATGVATGIHNTHGELVTKIPKRDFSRFCSNMFHSKEGHARCLASNCTGARRAFTQKGPHVHRCHAGLIDVFAPVIYKGRHLGSVCCGQLMFEKPTETKRKEVAERLAGLPESFIEKQLAALDNVTVVSEAQVHGLARLLESVSNEVVRLIIANQKAAESNKQKELAITEIQARSALETEIKNAQIRLKESELRLLEAQINPHFLYNTLDAIRWLASIHGQKDIQQMTFALGCLLRYSLRRGNGITKMTDELCQIKNYLYLQKMRHGEKLEFHINIERDVREFCVPKLILQPVVENAVKHGIEPSRETCHLWISGWTTEEGDVVLEVENNGVVLSAAEIEALNERLSIDDSGNAHVMERRAGYGLMNVQQRLRLTFGAGYGMRFSSGPAGSTVVKLRFPAVSCDTDERIRIADSRGSR